MSEITKTMVIGVLINLARDANKKEIAEYLQVNDLPGKNRISQLLSMAARNGDIFRVRRKNAAAQWTMRFDYEDSKND